MPRLSKFVPVGVAYCVEHDGLANEDEDVCDFSRLDDEPTACQFVELGYRVER